MTDRCPTCGVPYALVGRVHICRAVITNSESGAGTSAGAQAIGANQPAMGETPPAPASDAGMTANRGETGLIKRKRKPDTRKRKRAPYMRAYRARQKAPATGVSAQ